MATYTSSQSGNFSATATWGGSGPPVDGDKFVVASGHTVTIDSGISQPANGYDDSYINGILKNDTSADTELRMNGRLTINAGGLLHLNDNNGACNHTMQFKGAANAVHGIWQENAANANVVMEGKDGMPSTTLSTAEAENSTSLAFTDASNFAAGEWFAVFDNTTAQTSGTNNAQSNRDEGFVVHDIDSNTVYFRHFVGPDDCTVSSYSGSVLTVNRATVFRKGQYVIVGTGSNRTVGQINAINYKRNEITLSVSITGNPTGETIYLTGTQKPHASGEKVRKVATATTTASGTGTTITVADATQFVANDEIWIAAPYTGSGSDTLYDAYELKHTVSSVSGNNITLSSAPSYSVQSGAYVTRVSRHIKLKGASTSDHPFFRAESYTANYSRINIIKDIEFDNWGNTNNNNYNGLTWQGYFNSDAAGQSITLTQTVPENDQAQWLEGITACFANTRDRSGIYFASGARYGKARCCFVYKGYNSFGPTWSDGHAFYNCIAAYNSSTAARLQGQRNNNEFAYNYINRSYYGIQVDTMNYECGFGVHHNIVDATTHYAYYGIGGHNYGTDGVYCNDFRGTRYGMYSSGGSTMLYSRVKEAEIEAVTSSGVGDYGGTSQQGVVYDGTVSRGSFGGQVGLTILEFQFEHNQIAQYTYRSRRTWDHTEKAWAFRRRNIDEVALHGTGVYVPANTTVRVSCEVKIESGTTVTQYPRLQCGDNVSRQSENRLSNAVSGNTRFSSDRRNVFFTSACVGAWEEKTLEIPAQDHARHVDIGVGNFRGADHAGFYFRDPIIRFDTPYELPALGSRNFDRVSNFMQQIRNTFAQQKKRLGGRIK